MEYLLGIDIGTYGSKATLITIDGSIHFETSVEHDLSVPRAGWAEHDAEEIWWHDLIGLCARVLEQNDVSSERIRAVSTSAIAPCVVPVDKNGRPLRPAILYGVDTRSVDEIDELTEILGTEWLLDHAGSNLSTQSAGPKIRWLQKNEPEVWKETARIETSTSYLCFKLTGNSVIDHYTAAFYAPLYDLNSLAWSPTAAAHICSRDLLPRPQWTTAQAGEITAAAATETGLMEGTPVMVGTADAAAEAVSAGVLDPGELMLMHGSSVFIIGISSSLPRGGVFWSAPFLFPNTYALAGGMATTGAITQWFRRNFADPIRPQSEQTNTDEQSSSSGTDIFRVMAEEAAHIPAGSDQLVALPYFSGERTPINDPYARGIIAGLSLRHSRAHVYRALLEGVAYGVRHNLESLEESGSSIASITAVGGGTKNRTWMQIVTDVINRRQLLRTASGASHGDALLAGVGSGLIADRGKIRTLVSPGEVLSPDDAAVETYRHMYSIYRDLYESTKNTIHSLAGMGSENTVE